MSTLIYVKMGHAKNVAYGKADRLYTVALPQFGVSRKSWYFSKSGAGAYYKRYDALPWISGKSGSRRSSPQV